MVLKSKEAHTKCFQIHIEMQVRNHDCHINYNNFNYNICRVQEFFIDQLKKTKSQSVIQLYVTSVITVTVHKI